MQDYLVTSEAVTEGHPDKLCDQISDAVLDACLQQDSSARVAVEALVSKNTIFLAGEVTTTAKVDYDGIIRQVAEAIGYSSNEAGLDAKHCLVLTNVQSQSPDIARGVVRSGGTLGAGDQGIMYGYACDENTVFMPMPYVLANKLVMRLAKVRREGTVSWLYPDGKAQVTMLYDGRGNPQKVTSVLVSAHHARGIAQKDIQKVIRQMVIDPVLHENKWNDNQIRVLINPTGSFCVGGPAADTGLTGRKIMVDTYGGIAHHGGGAFSGKDPTKVDRSGAYMARYVAKHIVAAKLAKRCEVALAYAIGNPEPEAVSIETFGTQRIAQKAITKAVRQIFSFTVVDIINQLQLQKPQYTYTAAYGHFGREEYGFQWECLNRIDALNKFIETELNASKF